MSPTKRRRTTRKRREGDPQITQPMIRAFLRGDARWFYRTLQRPPWKYVPVHTTPDDPPEYEPGQSSYTDYCEMRALRLQILRAIKDDVTLCKDAALQKEVAASIAKLGKGGKRACH